MNSFFHQRVDEESGLNQIKGIEIKLDLSKQTITYVVFNEEPRSHALLI